MASASLLTPPPVPAELYVTNREKLLKSLRQHLADSARPLKGIVLLQVNLSATHHKILNLLFVTSVVLSFSISSIVMIC